MFPMLALTFAPGGVVGCSYAVMCAIGVNPVYSCVMVCGYVDSAGFGFTE